MLYDEEGWCIIRSILDYWSGLYLQEKQWMAGTMSARDEGSKINSKAQTERLGRIMSGGTECATFCCQLSTMLA